MLAGRNKYLDILTGTWLGVKLDRFSWMVFTMFYDNFNAFGKLNCQEILIIWNLSTYHLSEFLASPRLSTIWRLSWSDVKMLISTNLTRWTRIKLGKSSSQPILVFRTSLNLAWIFFQRPGIYEMWVVRASVKKVGQKWLRFWRRTKLSACLLFQLLGFLFKLLAGY